ncbi:MAG: hypothetical protein NTW21_03170 [Verrucomicrobia bacterium]|nr:hypothetical protein [Verrucomicrobiota bacterium]
MNHKFVRSCGVAAMLLAQPAFAQTKIVLDDADSGRVFEGLGAISQGGTSRNFADYPGKLDTVFKLFKQDTFPSWLFSVKHGATTLWERWDGWTPDKGFQNPGMNSFNHYSLGSCGEWMFSSLAGIDTDGAGFKKLMIRPTPGEGITWVKASYDSISGKIATSWKTGANRYSLDVTIPVNTTATVYVPAKDAAGVTESGKLATKAKGVTFLRMEANAAVYAVGSGTYRFQSTLPETVK